MVVGVAEDEGVVLVFPEVVAVRKVERFFPAQAAIAAVGGHRQHRIAHGGIVQVQVSVIGKGIIDPLDGPREHGGAIDLRRAPDGEAVGGALLLPEALAAPGFEVAVAVIAHPVDGLAGFFDVAGAGEGHCGPHRVTGPDVVVRAVVIAGDDAAMHAVLVESGAEQAALHELVKVGIGGVDRGALIEPAKPVAVGLGLGRGHAGGVEPIEHGDDFVVVHAVVARDVARDGFGAEVRTHEDEADGDILARGELHAAAHPALTLVAADAAPVVGGGAAARAFDFHRGGEVERDVLLIAGEGGDVVFVGGRDERAGPGDGAAGLVVGGHRRSGRIPEHEVVVIAAVEGGIHVEVDVGVLGDVEVVAEDHPLDEDVLLLARAIEAIGEVDAGGGEVELRDADVVVVVVERLAGAHRVGVIVQVALLDVVEAHAVGVAEPVGQTVDADADHRLVEVHLAALFSAEQGREGVGAVGVAFVLGAHALDAARGREVHIPPGAVLVEHCGGKGVADEGFFLPESNGGVALAGRGATRARAGPGQILRQPNTRNQHLCRERTSNHQALHAWLSHRSFSN